MNCLQFAFFLSGVIVSASWCIFTQQLCFLHCPSVGWAKKVELCW